MGNTGCLPRNPQSWSDWSAFTGRGDQLFNRDKIFVLSKKLINIKERLKPKEY